MWQKSWADLLGDEIDAVIALLPNAPNLRDLVKEPLRQAGRGLASLDRAGQPWSLLPMIVCEAICGDFKRALPAATARQFLMAAADVFDDIEDADSLNSLSVRYGPAIATNVATTLIILAEKAILRLAARGIDDGVIVRAADMLNSYYLTACSGQHFDLSPNTSVRELEDAYLRVASMKSASQAQCACHIGALVATASQDVTDKFCTFGHNVGMASQIANDIQGIKDGSDIVRPKMTLPMIYAMTHADGVVRKHLESIFGKRITSATDCVEVKEELFRRGAVHYAMIRMECYKQQARDILSEVERVGISVGRLKLLLA